MESVHCFRHETHWDGWSDCAACTAAGAFGGSPSLFHRSHPEQLCKRFFYHSFNWDFNLSLQLGHISLELQYEPPEYDMFSQKNFIETDWPSDTDIKIPRHWTTMDKEAPVSLDSTWMNTDERMITIDAIGYREVQDREKPRDPSGDPRWKPAPSTSGARCLQRVSWPWIAKTGKSCTNASMEEFQCPRSVSYRYGVWWGVLALHCAS